MKRHILMAGACAGLALAAATAAGAQSVDYGSLQQLFNEPVTTSATGSPQRSTEAPADMQIISADEIRRSGETSIPGVLQRVAGIDVLNWGAGQSDVNVRGYDQVSSPRLLVLVNGRQVYLDHYGMTVWATIPVQLDEIRQIEVVKGPSGALFGFNAASGVINIITYNPKFDPANEAKISGGLNGAKSGSMMTTIKLGDAFSMRLSGGGSSIKEWKNTGPLPTSSERENPASAKANLDAIAQLAPKTELRIEGSWSNTQEDLVANGYNYSVIKMVTQSEKATLTSDTAYGLIQGQVYQNKLDADYHIGPGILWHNTIDVASIQDLFKIGTANTFRISGEYRYTTLNTAPDVGGTVDYHVWSGAGMWNWVINPKLTWTAAVRIDDLGLNRTGTFDPRIILANNALWNRDLVENSENFTLAWRPTGADTFRASYGRAIQAPSLIEFGGIQYAYQPFPGFTIDIMGNPNLAPTVVANYELAYDHDFTIAKLGVRVFDQQWTNLISQLNETTIGVAPTLTTNAAMNYRNVANSTETGAEVIASGKLAEGLHWRADYTYTDVKDSYFAGFNPVLQRAAFQATTPKGRGNVGFDWENGPWEADANLHYVGAYQGYDITNGNLKAVSAYGSLSARLAYKMHNGVTFALSGQNLGSSTQVQTRGLEAQREAQFTISKAW